MVQRKLINKLGIQADHVESKKGSSPSQNQDTKNNGSDLKQKMKISRSIKHSDFESLSSTPPLRSIDVAQPDKTSTSDHVKTRTATPQRKSPEESPNYMKSTSSFDARRERFQVSSQTPQNVMMRKSMSPMKSNNSRHSSGSNNKPVVALARTSSLKLVRILTKTPSFKPARVSTKKYSPVALCEDFDVQKPTCSSTLKDSKMPKYLKLSAGATESEGTSAVKVCPYAYCSLNGHHHGALPPLKSFLSAKRRMLKAQKVIKLGCLSPRRAKPSRETMVKIDAKQVIWAEIPPTKGMDFDIRQVTPLMHEKQTDFFVEIYSNTRDDDTAKGKTLESLSSTAPCSVIHFEENLEAEKDQNVKEGAKIHSFPKTQEDEILNCLSTQCNADEESQPISQYGQSDSEASEMELEEKHHYKPSLDDVPNLKLKVNDITNGSNIESISKSDDNTKNSYEDILTDEVRVGFYDEKSESSGAWSDDGDSDMDGSYQNLVLDEPYLACNEQIQGKIYSTCDALENITSTSTENGNRESAETRVKENSISHQIEEFQATSVEKSQVPEAGDDIPKIDFQLGSDAIKCTSYVEEVLSGTWEDEAAQQECASWLLFKDFMEQDQDETHRANNAIHNSMKVELDSTIESRSSDDVCNESFSAKIQYEEADQEDREQNISTTDARDGMEEKVPLAAESVDGVRTSDSLEDNENDKLFFESEQESLESTWDKVTVNKDQNKQTDVTESETNPFHADETLPNESNGVENHEYPEVNQDQLQTYKFTSSKYSKDQMHSGPAVLKATPNQNQEADTGEGEYKTESNAYETSIIAKASTSTQKRDYMSHASNNSNEEMTQLAKNLSWTTGSRKTVAELEYIRDFNPREPNYLAAEPDLDPEKVDLRHQLMDERKNSEEWMVDYALRQAVTKLAPARRRKVSLLVEAFEKVLPTPKYETHPRHTSSAFVHARTIQACR